MHEPLPFAEFEALYRSVTRTPNVLNHRELMEALRSNTPSALREEKRSVNVLLSISVNEDGSVASVRAIVPELLPGITVRGIRQDEQGNYLGEIARPTADPECMAAAERAALVLRFSPAERDGQPVPFPDYRMTVGFG